MAELGLIISLTRVIIREVSGKLVLNWIWRDVYLRQKDMECAVELALPLFTSSRQFAFVSSLPTGIGLSN